MPAHRSTARVARPGAVKAPESLSDSECVRLMQRVVQRDERALQRLYNLTVCHVYGLALRITGQPEAARHVTEGVFVRAWNTARSYDSTSGSPLRWLLLACRTYACQASEQANSDIAHSAPSNLQNLLQATKGSAPLNEAIKRLPPRQRQLLNLAFFREMTHEQLADHTGTQESTVRSLMRHTMALLRDGLTDAPRRKVKSNE
jgi:RNA polymerase sigma factor (sigma-70 family)